MNGRIKDELQVAIDKVLNSFYDDDKRWPKDIIVPDTLAEHMANAAEVVFDSCLSAAAYAQKECA